MWKWCIGLLLAAAASALTPQQLVVVYNENSELSRQSALRYVELRGVPRENLVGLSGLSRQDVSREDYQRLVVDPLLKCARERDWRLASAVSRGGRKPVYAILLMPDFPMRVGAIRGKKPNSQVEKSSASLDSELALLGAPYSPSGCISNPSFEASAPFRDCPPAALSVCRIDAPNEAAIQGMLEAPVSVEKKGLWGWTVVDNGGPYVMGNKWMSEVVSLAQRAWQPLFHESSFKTLPVSFPLMQGVSVYFGWYSHAVNGPFSPNAAESFRFAPGAIAFHLFSYSCRSARKKDDWVGALLLRGAAVSAGNVDEPFLHLSLRPDIFYNRLLKGYCVAEAALMATPALSWQGVVLGDPLYRPYAARRQNRDSKENPFVQWALMSAECRGNYELMRERLPRYLSGTHGAFFAEAFAWYCLEKKSPGKAAEFFRMAFNASGNESDKLRNRILLISSLFSKGDQRLAQQMMRCCLEESVHSPHRPAVEATADVVLKEERDRERAEKKKRAPQNQR